MIVVDEDIHGEAIRRAIGSWYPGKVVSIVALRPQTLVKDDAISTLLHRTTKSTFVTINVKDFWHRVDPHPNYCIICLEILQQRLNEVSFLLRRLFQTLPFKTKSNRMGKIAVLSHSYVEYYDIDQQTSRINWLK